MKVAVIGPKTLTGLDLTPYIPKEADAILVGRMEGAGVLAAGYARKRGLLLFLYPSSYDGRCDCAASDVCSREMVEDCDLLIIFSYQEMNICKYANKIAKDCRFYVVKR